MHMSIDDRMSRRDDGMSRRAGAAIVAGVVATLGGFALGCGGGGGSDGPLPLRSIEQRQGLHTIYTIFNGYLSSGSIAQVDPDLSSIVSSTASIPTFTISTPDGDVEADINITGINFPFAAIYYDVKDRKNAISSSDLTKLKEFYGDGNVLVIPAAATEQELKDAIHEFLSGLDPNIQKLPLQSRSALHQQDAKIPLRDVFVDLFYGSQSSFRKDVDAKLQYADMADSDVVAIDGKRYSMRAINNGNKREYNVYEENALGRVREIVYVVSEINEGERVDHITIFPRTADERKETRKYAAKESKPWEREDTFRKIHPDHQRFSDYRQPDNDKFYKAGNRAMCA
jgi:hypothetical protein